jgi:hypothetical protein
MEVYCILQESFLDENSTFGKNQNLRDLNLE